MASGDDKDKHQPPISEQKNASSTSAAETPVTKSDDAAPTKPSDIAVSKPQAEKKSALKQNTTGSGITLSARALAAGGKRGADGSGGLARGGAGGGALATFRAASSSIGTDTQKWLVVGDGIAAPFMALCLRVHGLQCDLAHHPSTSDLDRGTIVLTPSVTQILGDVVQVGVPTGSVIGRILTFDHVGNDLCDIDLNEFREKGDAPTFFACDRNKIEQSMLSLCRQGQYSCNVMPKATIDRGAIQALDPAGVRVTFANGVAHDYQGIICTARNQNLVPELTLSNEELQRREENTQRHRMESAGAHRWLEVCVPPLPELGKNEKRFTPGSQEVVELLTPRASKMIVRPTMLATKLFYNVAISIPDQAQDPRLKATSMKNFWDEVIDHWTGGVPGYVTHTLWRPMFSHVQQHFNKSSALIHRTPSFVLPHWSEGEGRIIKIGHSVHQSNFDAIDISDAQAFSDCFQLARTLSENDPSKVAPFLDMRKMQVMEEHDFHHILTKFAMTERGQIKYAMSRFSMKMLRRYKRSWRHILNNYVSLIAKTPK